MIHVSMSHVCYMRSTKCVTSMTSLRKDARMLQLCVQLLPSSLLFITAASIAAITPALWQREGGVRLQSPPQQSAQIAGSDVTAAVHCHGITAHTTLNFLNTE